MEGMNFDRIGDDLVQAYEEGYQKGLEENKKNNNKLRNLERAIMTVGQLHRTDFYYLESIVTSK